MVEGNRAPAGRQWMEAGLELSLASAGQGGVDKYYCLISLYSLTFLPTSFPVLVPTHLHQSP